MKRHRILALLSALVIGMVVPTASVQATGNCSTAYVIFYDHINKSNPQRKYCYNVRDSDMLSEPGNVMGPLSTGSYLDDFDSSSSSSGIESVELQKAAGSAIRVCFYERGGWLFNSGSLSTDGSWANVAFDQIGSFQWTSGGSCPVAP